MRERDGHSGVRTGADIGVEKADHLVDQPLLVSGEQAVGAKLIEYDGSAHGLFASDKERLIKDLVGFLGSSGTGSEQRSAIPMSQTQPAY